MTGPRVDVAPPHIPSLAEWEQQQYVTGSSAASVIASPDAGKKMVGALTRIPTLAEFDQMQGMTAPAIKALRIPALPPIPAAARDVTATAADKNQKGFQPEAKAVADYMKAEQATHDYGKDMSGLHGVLARQLAAPALANPFTTVATLGAVPAAAAISPIAAVGVGAAMAGSMAYSIAQYGWQKAAEMTLSPEDRKRAEADPDRVSGESAAVQAAMLGLAPLIHVGVKGYKNLDVSTGMMEAGAKGLKDLNFGPDFTGDGPRAPHVFDFLNEKGKSAVKNSAFAAALEADAGRTSAEIPKAPGLVVPTDVQFKSQPRAVKGYAPNNPFNEVPDATSRVKPVEMQAPADVLQTTADQLNDPMRPRRRAATNFFEHPTGAETLGATAGRHGLPEEANPYHPDSPLAESWKSGHDAATGSYPEGFSMGGALTDNRIPGAAEIPKTAKGGGQWELPSSVTPETMALSDALKPSPYRAHTTEELANAALAAQQEIEQAQLAVTHGAQRGLVGEAAQADLENRGSSYSDESEASTKTHERALVAAKSKMAKIEREFALRGVSSDDLADVMKEAQAARDERAGMQQDETLGNLPGNEPAPTATGLAPVAGTGERATRGLSRGVEQKAVANKLIAGLGDLPEYQRVSMADQSARAVNLLDLHPELARQVALGEVPAPDGLFPESVFVAVENKAIAEGDVATIHDLATGKLTAEATEMGQRIRVLGERDPESAVAALKTIGDAKIGGRKVPRATEALVAKLRKMLEATSVTPEKLAEFVNSMRC